MTSKATPPVPPGNRSPKGTGDDKRASPGSAAGGSGQVANPEQRGQTGNTKQNTTHQGHQQDR